MAVEVEPVDMGCAMPPDDTHRVGDSGAPEAAASSALPTERDAQPRTAVPSLDEPYREVVALRSRADAADR
jgi:hypothetical protein